MDVTPVGKVTSLARYAESKTTGSGAAAQRASAYLDTIAHLDRTGCPTRRRAATPIDISADSPVRAAARRNLAIRALVAALDATKPGPAPFPMLEPSHIWHQPAGS